MFGLYEPNKGGDQVSPSEAGTLAPPLFEDFRKYNTTPLLCLKSLSQHLYDS